MRTLDRDELQASIDFASRDRGGDQLELFGQNGSQSSAINTDARIAFGDPGRGIDEYSAIQGTRAQLPAQQLSVMV